MDALKEFKDLLQNEESLKTFCNQYFMAFSQDQKYIYSNDFSEIVMQICDERGLEAPSNSEIYEWERKKDMTTHKEIQMDPGMGKKQRSVLTTSISYENFIFKIKLLLELLIEKS